MAHTDFATAAARFAARFAASYALLRAAADVADHWVQSDHQAANKGWHDGDQDKDGHTHTSAEGRAACLAHIASYTATQGAALLIGSKVLGMRLRPGRAAAALAVSAATHYIADRRQPLKDLAGATGKSKFYGLADFGMNGAYALDQAWHHGWETAAALLVAKA